MCPASSDVTFCVSFCVFYSVWCLQVQELTLKWENLQMEKKHYTHTHTRFTCIFSLLIAVGFDQFNLFWLDTFHRSLFAPPVIFNLKILL